MKTYNQRPYILNEKTWVCPKHLPALKMPKQAMRCWMCQVEQPQPPRKNKPIRVVKSKDKNKPHFCAWEQCTKGDNGKRAASRKTSKYCSTYCKNAYARFRHRQRKQNT